MLAAVTTGMVVSAAISIWQQSIQYAEGRRDLLLATAGAFSAAVAPSTWDRDARGALLAIRGIGSLPDILFAEVQTTDGAALAQLGSAPRLVGDFTTEGAQSALGVFASRTIRVSVPIVHAGQSAGRLILIGGTAGLWDRLIGSLAITALGGLAALVVGLVVAWRLQRGITIPLRALVRATAEIQKHHNYDLSIENAGDREIGLLVDGFRAMLGDIRDRDARLAEHRRNLEQEVADRTRDMREARDAAETANRAKSEFLATMSHEIRTPMNGIMVMAELLANSEMPRRQQHYAQVIENSSHSLLAIINDILDLSKIESGKLELEKVPLDVVKLAETVVTLFAERAQGQGIDLAALVAPATPRSIVGDPVRTGQIVSNLVNNALKFTQAGFVHLVIEPLEEDPAWLRLSVRDTGIGIPAEKLDAIFEAFSQADQSTTRQFGGTGLGLTISKRLVLAMGGRIEVSSAVGEGSTFTVTLPVGEASEPAPWPRLPRRHEGLPLCVIDLMGEATASTSSRYFSASGYRVVRADKGMPTKEYEGASLLCVDAETLRAREPRRRDGRHQTVVAVARFADDSAVRLVEDDIADAVLTKPLMRTEIEDLLARIAAGESILPMKAVRNASLPQFRGLKVLVADDTLLNREVAIEALARFDVSVETVEDGAQAIAAVQEGHFDVVLMDGSMPDVDGFTATREIRSLEIKQGRKRLPIVGLTAHVIGTSADAWRDAGMDEVIHKPYTLMQLAACLQRLFPDWSAAEQDPDEVSTATGATLDALPGDRNNGKRPALLDASVLQELREMGRDNPRFLRRIFDLYSENAPPACDAVLQAARANDLEACWRAAHFLKSMSYNIGAARVAASADAIEWRSRQESTVPNDDELSALTGLLGETLAAVAAIREQAPAHTASDLQNGRLSTSG